MIGAGFLKRLKMPESPFCQNVDIQLIFKVEKKYIKGTNT